MSTTAIAGLRTENVADLINDQAKNGFTKFGNLLKVTRHNDTFASDFWTAEVENKDAA